MDRRKEKRLERLLDKLNKKHPEYLNTFRKIMQSNKDDQEKGMLLLQLVQTCPFEIGPLKKGEDTEFLRLITLASESEKVKVIKINI